jgi:hypothetical protein
MGGGVKTKLQKAVEQTVEKWSPFRRKSISCGFCEYYGFDNDDCDRCPVYKTEGMECDEIDAFWIPTQCDEIDAFWIPTHGIIPLELAIMIYCWGFLNEEADDD